MPSVKKLQQESVLIAIRKRYTSMAITTASQAQRGVMERGNALESEQNDLSAGVEAKRLPRISIT